MLTAGPFGSLNFLDYPEYGGLWIKAFDLARLDAKLDSKETELVEAFRSQGSKAEEALRVVIENELIYVTPENVLGSSITNARFVPSDRETVSELFVRFRSATLTDEAEDEELADYIENYEFAYSTLFPEEEETPRSYFTNVKIRNPFYSAAVVVSGALMAVFWFNQTES